MPIVLPRTVWETGVWEPHPTAITVNNIRPAVIRQRDLPTDLPIAIVRRLIKADPCFSMHVSTVCVLGGTGFIGRRLVRTLIGRGDNVIVLARDTGKAVHMYGPQAEVVGSLADLPADRACTSRYTDSASSKSPRSTACV